MKRILAIQVILIVLLTAIQPALVLHYCGGKLNSIGLVKTGLPKSCCGGEGDNCCSNQIFKIATDDYQLQQQDFTEIFSQVPIPGFFLLSDNLFSGESFDPLVTQHTFPPGGVDLIHRFCVYRI
jgi:hypothetical protein